MMYFWLWHHSMKLMIFTVLQHSTAREDDESDPQSWDNATFDCELDIDDDHWKLKGESGDLSYGSDFLTFTFQGMLDSSKPLGFRELLNSSKKSEIYACDEFFRAVIRIDPSAVSSYCRNDSKHSSLLSRTLSESDIKRLRITQVSGMQVFKSVLGEASHLTEIWIYNTSFFNVSSLPFFKATSLQVLILKENAIKDIPDSPFKKYSLLRTLDLSRNHLSLVNEHSFSGLGSVSDLDLSFNLLSQLPPKLFSRMPMLKKLFLQNNKITHMNDSIFQSNNELQVINLSSNDLKVLPPKLFHSLSELTNVSCTNCSLLALSKDLFKSCPKVLYIQFDHNCLQNIPDGAFSGLKYLRRLNLGFNSIQNITQRTFQFLPYLGLLNLTRNSIRHLEKGIFDEVPNIGFLDMSWNELEILTDDHVDKFRDLEFFDLTYNRIVLVELGKLSDVLIRKLYLSNNLISKLDINWKRMLFLEVIQAESNFLTSFEIPPCIPSIKQTITFSFKKNNISTVNMSSLLEDEARVVTDRKMMMSCFFNGLSKNFIDLTHNPLHCDCSLFPFYEYAKNRVPKNRHLDSFLDAGNLTCASPKNLEHQRILNLENDALVCLSEKDCPKPCTCGIRGNDNLTFANCSGRTFFTLPSKFPNGTTVLYFRKNRVRSETELNQMDLDGFTEIHLDENSLESLEGWKFPLSMRVLSLRGNLLKTLPKPLMSFIENQTEFMLFLGGNDKNCSCETEIFKNFLTDQSKFVGDVDDILCRVTNNGTTSFLPLVSVPDSELCRPQELVPGDQIIMVISLCSFFVFALTVLVFYYKQRQLVLSFLYSHFSCPCLRDEAEDDDDRPFDAFVAYSSSDRGVVMQLLRELEGRPPHFRLCIHERNWLPGRFISDNILSSVQNSRRTIVVLSRTFLASPWFNLELRAAVPRLSKDKVSRIIVVMTEKSVLLDDVDPELRQVISGRTYLVWGERWFWEKLRYAMPRRKAAVVETEGGRAIHRSDSSVSLIMEAV